MRSVFTEDFFKNLIGFATILLIGIGVTSFAANDPQKQSAHVPETVQGVQ